VERRELGRGSQVLRDGDEVGTKEALSHSKGELLHDLGGLKHGRMTIQKSRQRAWV